MNFYKRHIGDYVKDTAHLSLLEHGIYTRLLDIYYTRERALPDFDKTARLVGARSDEERSALRDVLNEFFTAEPDGFSHDRCDREIASAAEKAEKNREVGKLGGRPKKEETKVVSGENHDGFQNEPTDNPSQKPVTSNQKPDPRHGIEKKETRAARSPSPRKTPIPDGFEVSDRVAEWAASKGHARLADRLEHFRSACKAKGYTYADWDEAFMTAVRDDWAKFSSGANGARASPGSRSERNARAMQDFLNESSNPFDAPQSDRLTIDG